MLLHPSASDTFRLTGIFSLIFMEMEDKAGHFSCGPGFLCVLSIYTGPWHKHHKGRHIRQPVPCGDHLYKRYGNERQALQRDEASGFYPASYAHGTFPK